MRKLNKKLLVKLDEILVMFYSIFILIVLILITLIIKL